jgi:hypothetical protein
MEDNLIPEERELADALQLIANKYGKFNDDNTGVWAGYTPASENLENSKIGVKCGNCVFFNAPNVCSIIAAEVEEGGLCRFAVLPDGTVNASGGAGAPAEILDMNKIKKPKSSQFSFDDVLIKEIFPKAPSLVQDELKSKIKKIGDSYTEEQILISDLIPTQNYLDLTNFKDLQETSKPVTVYRDGNMFKLVNGHHRCASKALAGKKTIKARVYTAPMMATAGSKPAPKKDQIKGSDKNKKGSAATGEGIKFTDAITKSLEKKVADHNEKAKNGRKVTLAKLKAVYRRGAGAYSTSHRPDQNRNSWAMARVNAFLKLVKSGKPTNPKYVQDNDLLPKMHPRHSEASTMSPLLASMVAALDEDECPPATRDIVLNVTNRQNAIDNVGYGPLNPKEPSLEFWQEKADRWDTTPVEAKKSICGNCVFFIKTPKMLDCIASGIEEGGSGEQNAWDAIDQADLGFCEALDFKCAASRTCNAWAAGGPIE